MALCSQTWLGSAWGARSATGRHCAADTQSGGQTSSTGARASGLPRGRDRHGDAADASGQAPRRRPGPSTRHASPSRGPGAAATPGEARWLWARATRTGAPGPAVSGPRPPRYGFGRYPGGRPAGLSRRSRCPYRRRRDVSGWVLPQLPATPSGQSEGLGPRTRLYPPLAAAREACQDRRWRPSAASMLAGYWLRAMRYWAMASCGRPWIS